VSDVETIIPTYEEAMGRTHDQFAKIITPESGRVYTGEWAYTWVLWYRDPRAVGAFASIVEDAGLFHFRGH